MALYDAYDKNSEQQGLGWADQWDYKYNDKYGSTEDYTADNQGSSSSSSSSSNGKEKLAKVKSGVDKTKSAVSSGAHKVASGTSSGFKWIKDKVHKK